MKFKFKPKPKLNIKESLDTKSIVLKKLDTKLEVEFDIDDVQFKGQINVDLNYQDNKSLKDRVNSANFSATKKF